MSIKYNENAKTYEVAYCKRHPVSRVPKGAKRKGIKTMAEAKRIYAELVLQVNDKIRQSVVPSWFAVSQEYAEVSLNRGLSKKTVDDAHSCLAAHTYKLWAGRCIDTITANEIRVLVTETLGSRSVSHQKNMLKHIRSVFNYAVEKGIIQNNPSPKLKFRVGDKIKAVLTEKQIQILLNKAKEHDCEWYPHWTMALYTGMRNGELYALTWDKVNFDSRTIKVDCSWNNVDGFKSTKSGDDRNVAIAPSLVPILAELKLAYPESTFVLPRIDCWDKGAQARELRMFLKGVGLPEIRFHDLRASWATVMMSKGVEPIKVMYMGGWKDMKTMMIYMRKAGIEIQGIADCLELHNPSKDGAQILNFASSSNS